jgi:hypothetical protein
MSERSQLGHGLDRRNSSSVVNDLEIALRGTVLCSAVNAANSRGISSPAAAPPFSVVFLVKQTNQVELALV